MIPALLSRRISLHKQTQTSSQNKLKRIMMDQEQEQKKSLPPLSFPLLLPTPQSPSSASLSSPPPSPSIFTSTPRRKHIHSKYMTAQEVANMVVLQPPVQDKVLPLLLIDLRPYEEYYNAHIEWAISMQITDQVVNTPEEELMKLINTIKEESLQLFPLKASPRKRRCSDGSPNQMQGMRHSRSRSSSSLPGLQGISLSINTSAPVATSTNQSDPASPRSAPAVPISPRMTSNDPTAEAVLRMLETTCFQEKVFEHKFQWRHISHAVLFIDVDDNNPDSDVEKAKKKKCRWLYRWLKREHRIKALSILKCSLSEFQKAFPYLITNKRHKEYDFPTIVNSCMYLGSYRLLTQQMAIDVVLKKKLGIQYVLNCASECPDGIPEKYMQANQITFMKLNLEPEVVTSVTECFSFQQLKQTILFIEGARRHHLSLCSSEPSSASSSPETDPSQPSPPPFTVQQSPRQNTAKLLVLCHEGRCRSIFICCIYFMLKFCWSLEACIQYFRVNRPLVNITPPYMNFLEKMEEILRNADNQLSARMTEVESHWSEFESSVN